MSKLDEIDPLSVVVGKRYTTIASGTFYPPGYELLWYLE